MDKLLVLTEDFGEWDLLKPQDKKLFESSSYEDVQQDLNVIQSQRVMTETMMNMKRLQPFLTCMAHLEKVLYTIRFQHTAKVMGYVWGPVRFLLKVRPCAISIPTNIAHQSYKDHESHGESIRQRTRHIRAARKENPPALRVYTALHCTAGERGMLAVHVPGRSYVPSACIQALLSSV